MWEEFEEGEGMCQPSYFNFMCKNSNGYHFMISDTYCDPFGFIESEGEDFSCKDTTHCEKKTISIGGALGAFFGFNAECGAAIVDASEDIPTEVPLCISKGADAEKLFTTAVTVGKKIDPESFSATDDMKDDLKAICTKAGLKKFELDEVDDDDVAGLLVGSCRATSILKIWVGLFLGPALDPEGDFCINHWTEDECGKGCTWGDDMMVCLSDEQYDTIFTDSDPAFLATFNKVSNKCKKLAANKCDYTLNLSDDWEAAAKDGVFFTVTDDEVSQTKPGFTVTYPTSYPNELTTTQEDAIATQFQEEIEPDCADNPLNCPIQVLLKKSTTSAAKKRRALLAVSYDLTVTGRYSSESDASAAATALSSLSAEELTALASTDGAEAATITPQSVSVSAAVGESAAADDSSSSLVTLGSALVATVAAIALLV
jgi:hypothetical protein